MTKIQVDADEMMRIANDMAKEVVNIETDIDLQTKIIKGFNEYDWEGEDYDSLLKRWTSFANAKDDKIKDQFKQYSLYLFGFHCDLINRVNEIKKIANNLPQ